MLLKIAGLASANLISPLITFFSTLILARLYAPNDFGDFYFYLTLSMVMATIASGQFFQGLGVTKSLVRSRALFFESIWFCIFCSLLLGLFLALVSFFYSSPTDLMLVSVAICFFYAGNQVASAYFVRLRKIHIVSILVLVKAVMAAVFQILFGLILKGDVLSLELGYLFGEASAFFLVLLAFERSNFMLFTKRAFDKEFCEVKKNLSFFLHYMPSQFLSLLINFVPVFFLKSQSGSLLLGVYSMTQRLVAGPANSIANAVRATYWRFLVDKKKDLWVGCVSFFGVFSILNILLFAVLYSFNLRLAALILGDGWDGVDNYLPFAALWAGASFSAIFPVEVVKNTGRQKWILRGELMGALIKVSFVVCSWMFFQDLELTLYAWFLGAFAASSVVSGLYLVLISKERNHGFS